MRLAFGIGLLALLIALGAVVGGCGGDSDDEGQTVTQTVSGEPSESASAAPTKAEFIAAGDAICAAGDEERESLDTRNPDTFKEAAQNASKLQDSVKDERDKFAALTPPPGDEAVIGGYLAAIDEYLVLVRQYEEAALDEDKATMQTYSSDADVQASEDHGIAQGYGFKVCGQTP